jgi:hypothetical protein
MTIAAVHFAYCDSGRDDCPYQNDAATEGEGSRKDLLDEMRSQGWKLTTQRTHICPTCASREVP